MRQGRLIIWCALAVLAGNVAGDALPLSPLVYLILSLAFAALAIVRPQAVRLPLWPLLALFMLAAASVRTGRMPVGEGMSSGRDTLLMAWASGCKASFSAWLGRLLPEGDELAVLRALSIGDKSSLTRDLRSSFRDSGAMHLLALSGLHVGLVYALLRWLLAPLGGHQAARLFRSAVILLSLWTYALITGMSASISRAVLMITFYELSGYLSGDRDGLSALAGSALLLMLFRPESPRDIGFQLSYTAVLSILLFYPRLSRCLQTRSRLLQKVWELLSVSICCQATCGVLAWMYFGSFPRYFLLTTLLAIPLTTVVLYMSAATIAIAGLSSCITQLFSASSWLASLFDSLSGSAAAALHWLLHLLNTIIRLISGL